MHEDVTIRMSDLTAGGTAVARPGDVKPQPAGGAGAGSPKLRDRDPGPMTISADTGTELFTMRQNSGFGIDAPSASAQAVLFSGPPVRAVPALASAQLLTALRKNVGDTYETTGLGGGAKVTLHFVGVLDAIPGADPDPTRNPGSGRPVLVLPQDFYTWRDAPNGNGHAPEWWAAAAPGPRPHSWTRGSRRCWRAIPERTTSPTGRAWPPRCATIPSPPGSGSPCWSAPRRRCCSSSSASACTP
ncbi:hypothetical protein ACFQ9X_41880 [Catenulispora yoronensis]